MTSEEFNALFDSVRSSVFRLEARQDYAIPADDASLVAFRTGRPRPERSIRTNSWLRRIAASTIAGVEWSRVRVVEHPLTEYTRWELLAYVESQATGERIDIVERDDVAGPDFWLLDADTSAATAVLMHYAQDGELLDRELVTGQIGIAELITRRDAASKHAISLNEFLARQDERGSAQ